MQTLFKQLSLASSDGTSTQQTDTHNLATQGSNSTPSAETMDMRSTAQRDAVQEHTAESCDDSAASPGPIAESSFSCHTSGSVSAPVTPAMAYRLEQSDASDSTSGCHQAATTQPSADQSGFIGACAVDAVPSHSASSISEQDVGLDEAIQACSDLIVEIEGEMDRKGKQQLQHVRIASSWKSVFALSVGSAFAVCSGTVATWGNMGFHISAINWHPT